MDLGPETRVVASFTVVVALLLGSWSALDALLAGPSGLFGEPEIGGFLAAAVPFLVTGVAVQAAGATEHAWARTLGGAAVLVGGLCCVGAVLYFLTGF